MSEIELPTGKRKPVSKNPHTLLLYSKPKVGKTTIVSQLENSLLIEHEPHGADFVEASVVEINKPSQLKELFKKIKDAGRPYKYLIVDTITKWDEWSEIVGTLNYMNKSQGKKFNAKDPNNLTKGRYSRTDKEFETVHSLGNGAGYAHSRAAMTDWYDQITVLADHIIFLAHVKDKYVATNRGDTVEATDISLTGKVKFIYCTRVDSVGMLTKEGNECIINFDNENNEIVGGRCDHLDGKIVISKKLDNGKVETYWDKIYLK